MYQSHHLTYFNVYVEEIRAEFSFCREIFKYLRQIYAETFIKLINLRLRRQNQLACKNLRQQICEMSATFSSIN